MTHQQSLPIGVLTFCHHDLDHVYEYVYKDCNFYYYYYYSTLNIDYESYLNGNDPLMDCLFKYLDRLHSLKDVVFNTLHGV